MNIQSVMRRWSLPIIGILAPCIVLGTVPRTAHASEPTGVSKGYYPIIDEKHEDEFQQRKAAAIVQFGGNDKEREQAIAVWMDYFSRLSPEEYRVVGESLSRSSGRMLTQSNQSMQMLVTAQGGTNNGPPVDGDGKPLPPPVKLPPHTLPDGTVVPNEWVPVPGSAGGTRGTKWKPKYTIPGQSQPGGSWDPDTNGRPSRPHWDVDTGTGERVRVTPKGERLDPRHNPLPDTTPWPPPFVGLDPAIVAAFAGLSVLAIIGGVILWILWNLSGAGAA